jgi:hypothetical protein
MDQEARICAFCGKPVFAVKTLYEGLGAAICNECVLAAAGQAAISDARKPFKFAYEALRWHFTGLTSEEIVTSSRRFPGHMRVDLQRAVERLLSNRSIRCFGINETQRYQTLAVSVLMLDGHEAQALAPLHHYEVDIGEVEVARCLGNALWLCADGDLRYAVVLSQDRESRTETGIRIEIAVPAGARGAALVQDGFCTLAAAVNDARAYRGKILSLEQPSQYRGTADAIRVHRLPSVRRDALVLPDATVAAIERSILNFAEVRPALRALGQSTRKGVLLYGSPGTGKTHTIRYLAGHLPDHTTLIITAEQIALLGQYMTLARVLQPAMVVIEDADLIARDREHSGGLCQEVLLNKLLNEMDGLNEEADILFVLTTNRPQVLEAALANRPGRIDEAIEIPLPDYRGREQLIRLYGRGLEIKSSIVSEAVRRTQGVSAAFIKEMMRRVAQTAIMIGDGKVVTGKILRIATHDMLTASDRFNTALLGGAATPGGAAVEPSKN